MNAGEHGFKSQIYDQLSRIGKAVAHPGRLELLDLLSQGERSVEALSQQSLLGHKNTSAQLKELRTARLVRSRRKGKHIYYRLADDSVLAFIHLLRRQAEKQYPELDSLIRSRLPENQDLLPTHRQKDMVAKAATGKVVLIDVRPEEEYRAGHLPHALSIPIKRLTEKIADLPRGKEMVVYCRGPYCVWAADAVQLLLERSFSAYRMEMGVGEWQLMGEALEISEDSDE